MTKKTLCGDCFEEYEYSHTIGSIEYYECSCPHTIMLKENEE